MAAAPSPFGIEGLNVEVYADFRAGRVTEDNLSEMKPESLLLANNILILADKMPTKRPGYTLVKNIGAGPVIALFDFQRDFDQAQFLIFQSGGKLGSLDVHGSGAVATLSAAEDLAKSYQFVGSPFALYMSNGVKSQALFDNAGTNRLYKMGISAPVSAPSVALGAGTLTATYGYQYAYCYVRKITDGTGVTRYHIGPPSPLSVSTNPFTNQVVTVGTFAAPPDATWNFIWIFRTNDSPPNSTAALFFLAEIAIATPTYADSLTDIFLDLTRPIPYDNLPPPVAEIMFEFASRVIMARIPGSPNAVQASGFEEILLGLPQECFPAQLFFQVPGGKNALSAGIVWDEKAYLCTKDYWWSVSGYDVETFQKRDKIMQPGAVGKKALTGTPTHLVWLARDKKLYAWDGASALPINVSQKLQKPLFGSLSMEDLSSTAIENSEVRWYSFGRYALIVVLANTGAVPAGQFDWIQIWNASFLGETLQDGSPVMLSETDFFPSDVMSTSALVEVDNSTFLFLGDPNGNIYRWPDGNTDAGKPFTPALCTPWSFLKVFIGQMFHPIPGGEVVKRIFWGDLHSDRSDTKDSFHLVAVVWDSPDMRRQAVNIPFEPLYATDGSGPVPSAARAAFYKVPGCAVGRWVRCFITFPGDDQPATLTRFGISARPLYGVNP